MWYYNLVDNVDSVFVAVVMVEIVSEKIFFLSFLGGLIFKVDII